MTSKQCPECGKAISDTDTFCKNCGFPLNIQSGNSGDDSSVPIANSNTDEPRHKTSNKKPLIIICIISTLLAMLLAIGFAIAFFSSKNDVNDSLLADIGQTYGEISAKYAEATSINGFEGDLYADISGRQYCFAPGKDSTSAYSGDFDSIMPNDNAVCVSIDAAARDLFFEFSGGMSSSDLESHGFSATVVSSRPSAAAGEVEGNYCYFEYENCEVYILLAENSDVFFPNSQVFIQNSQEPSLKLDIQKKTITGSTNQEYISTYAVLENGTVIGEGPCGDEVKTWTDIVSVAEYGKDLYGLKSNGTVVCTESGNHECEKWTNIVDISVCGHLVGLRSNGTVVAAGGNGHGECNVQKWNNIVAISTELSHTVGLKSDGTVVATGDNYRNCCEVQDWTDIVAIATGWYITVGLKSDGTVVSTEEDVMPWDDVRSWTDIVAISVSGNYTAGLRSDGTVVATKLNPKQKEQLREYDDIAAIFTMDGGRLICLRSDGRVVESRVVEPNEDESDCIRNRWDIMWPTNARVSRSFLYQEGVAPVWDEEIPGDGELTFYVTVINDENPQAKEIRTYKLHTTGDKDVFTALLEMNEITYSHMTNRGPRIISVLGTRPTTELPIWTFYHKGVPDYEWGTKVENGEHYIFELT